MPKVMRPGQMFDISITHIDPPRDGKPVTVNIALRTPDEESKLIVGKDDSLPPGNTCKYVSLFCYYSVMNCGSLHL